MWYNGISTLRKGYGMDDQEVNDLHELSVALYRLTERVKEVEMELSYARRNLGSRIDGLEGDVRDLERRVGR